MYLSRFTAMLVGFLLAMLTFAPAHAQAQASNEPTVAQIYQAANSGDMARAQTMIDEVLQKHPNSARAHYVKSELSARQHNLPVAREELASAERLAPGLPFVKPESAQALKRQISQDTAATGTPPTRQLGAGPDRGVRPAEAPARGLPWGTLAIVALVIVGAMAFMRRRRDAAASYGAPGAGYGGGTPAGGPYNPNAPMQGGPGMQPGYGPQYGGQPSMGGSLMRGVGTGLAVGAGAVAATEIGRRMFGHHDNTSAEIGNAGIDPAAIDAGMNADMGGDNFGMSDGGNWDDAGGGTFGGDAGGGDDWST